MAALAFVLGMLFVFPPQDAALEKRAITYLQQLPASKLDDHLPGRAFGSWFDQTAGARAGIQWQVTDCGEQTGTEADRERDFPLCVEAIAVLPDERKAVIDVQVGTFNRGILGEPRLYFAVVEYKGEFYSAERLSELPAMLRRPAARLEPEKKRKPVILPALNQAPQVYWLQPYILRIPEVTLPGTQRLRTEATPPPPPLRRIKAGVPVLGEAIVKVMPSYPDSARQFGARGKVEVEITVDEDGRVIQATSLSGHPMLRAVAETAARKWVYKPATLAGKPIRAKGTVTFVFTER